MGLVNESGFRAVPSRKKRAVPEAEKPDFLESIGLGFDIQLEDNPGAYQMDRHNAYAEIAKTLAEAKGLPLDHYMVAGPGYGQDRAGADRIHEPRLWAELEAYRREHPGSFADLPATREQYDAQWEGERNRTIEAMEARSSLGSGVGRFIGGMGGAFADPINIVLLPLGGGGKTILSAALREAALNAAIEGVEQPLVAQERRHRGRELTAGEAAMNVGGAFLLGGAIGGGGKMIVDHWGAIRSAPKATQEKVWGAMLDRVPSLREKVGRAVDWDALDDHLPELAEGMISAKRMTADERAAVALLRQDKALAAGSPFVQDAAGREATQAAMIDQWRAGLEAAPAASSRTRFAGSTSISSGVAGGDARAVFKQRVRAAESGGNDAARNALSSATGRYQFIDDTWLRLYKNRFGAGGLTDAQILAKRSEGRVQDALMDDLIALNERALRSDGIAITPGNLYLAHFAGSEGARRLHARPEAAVENVLGGAAVEANPFLRGMTAREVIAWADRKMGGPGGVSVAARTADDAGARLREDLTRLSGERTALENDLGLTMDNRAVDDALGENAVPLPEALDDIPTVRPEAISPREEALGPDVMLSLPEVRRVVAERGRSLNRTSELARELGMDEAQLRSALDHLVATGGLRQTAKGHYVRPPREGPEDVLKFIARRGGLRDDEGHALGLAGLSEKQRRALMPSQRKAAERARRGGRDLQRFVPGAGMLLRPEGRSLDDMGELLHEAGYFGPPSAAERPTTGAVLDLVERASRGERILPSGAEPTESAGGFRGFQSEEHYAHVRGEWDETARRLFGRALDEDEFARALALWENETILPQAGDDLGGGLDPEDALAPYLVEMVNRELDDARFDAFAEVEDEIYGAIEDGLRHNLEGEDILGRQGGEGSTADAGNAGAQPSRGGYGPGDAGEAELATGPIEPDRYADFDDPAGDGAKAQADSLVHDMENAPDMFGGPTPGDRRAALERKGDEPLRGQGEQLAAGSEGGLFDNLGEIEFRFDEDGEAISGADLLADIREDEAMLKAIRDCL